MQLNSENYFSLEADREYFSVSQVKSFLACEAKQMALLNGDWQKEDKKAFLIGSYVHAWNSGDLQEFISKNYSSIYKKNGEMYADFIAADQMINTLKNDKFIERMREGEKELIYTAELFGAKWKIAVDIINDELEYFNDIKTARSIREKYWDEETRQKVNFIKNYRYDIQMAVYAEVVRINKGLDYYYHPHIIAVDKQSVPDKEIIYMGREFIPEVLQEVSSYMPRLILVKGGNTEPARCGKCDYCLSTKKITEAIFWTDL
ncbi:PD-(D/E)XK nuclease-like domain-containing protein [Pelosinus baikalensis]|uniref:PD-(D/E)XK nuclease-like domain-containing protein n=1 Tax=Pelosinus baikalensis TaxID=2892015 RepID=A0ABS8HSR5_9FIRM|nr:PD-(D/E)XK nuclease-like domain-containing protein [Pelosinus baikalensis]MCC5465569.1 PD-(D/E)XK nuclease-like domain-containing protein [Pelosinus baikalensis]